MIILKEKGALFLSRLGMKVKIEMKEETREGGRDLARCYGRASKRSFAGSGYSRLMIEEMRNRYGG